MMEMLHLQSAQESSHPLAWLLSPGCTAPAPEGLSFQFNSTLVHLNSLAAPPTIWAVQDEGVASEATL